MNKAFYVAKILVFLLVVHPYVKYRCLSQFQVPGMISKKSLKCLRTKFISPLALIGAEIAPHDRLRLGKEPDW